MTQRVRIIPGKVDPGLVEGHDMAVVVIDMIDLEPKRMLAEKHQGIVP